MQRWQALMLTDKAEITTRPGCSHCCDQWIYNVVVWRPSLSNLHTHEQCMLSRLCHQLNGWHRPWQTHHVNIIHSHLDNTHNSALYIKYIISTRNTKLVHSNTSINSPCNTISQNQVRYHQNTEAAKERIIKKSQVKCLHVQTTMHVRLLSSAQNCNKEEEEEEKEEKDLFPLYEWRTKSRSVSGTTFWTKTCWSSRSPNGPTETTTHVYNLL